MSEIGIYTPLLKDMRYEKVHQIWVKINLFGIYSQFDHFLATKLCMNTECNVCFILVNTIVYSVYVPCQSLFQDI